MMRYCLLVVLLCGLISPAAPAIAQRQIVILDSALGEAVVGARIIAMTDSSRILGRALTDIEGRVKLPVAARLLSIHSLGYDDVILAPSDTLYLSAIDRRHQEVVVTATRNLSTTQNVPVSTTVVAAAEMLERQEENLDDVLRNVTGVTVADDQISIRGSSGYAKGVGSRVLVLLDGLPVVGGDNGDVKFDMLPVFAVKQVEVIKGAGSSLYGSSALGGMVNVITREPEPGLHYGLRLSASQYSDPKYDAWKTSVSGKGYRLDGGITTNINDFGLLVAGNLDRTDGYRIGDDQTQWSGYAKAVHPLGGGILKLSQLASNADHGGWLYWKSLNDPLRPNDSLSAVNERIHSFKSNSAVEYSKTFSDLSFSGKLAYYHTKFTTDPKAIGAGMGAHSAANSLLADASISAQLKSGYFLMAGLAGGSQAVLSDLFGNHKSNTVALFSQIEITEIERLKLTVGAREDFVNFEERTQAQFSPRAGATYHLADDLLVRGSAGYGFRSPTIAERYTAGTLYGFPIAANPNLRPERSQSVEIGFERSNSDYESDFKLGLSIFGARYQDLIEAGFQRNGSIQFENVTDARIYGIETEIQSFFNHFTIGAGYTFLKTEDVSTGRELKFRAPHTLRGFANVTLLPFKIGGQVRYRGNYAELDSTLAVYVPDALEQTPALVLDAQVSYDLNGLSGVPIVLTLEGENLLNRYYVDVPGNLAPLRRLSLHLQTLW